MSYTVLIERRALKQLKRIPPPHHERIKKAVRALSEDPRPADAAKLTGRSAWRIRIGEYRVIYEINDEDDSILVVVLGPRGEVYKQ